MVELQKKKSIHTGQGKHMSKKTEKTFNLPSGLISEVHSRHRVSLKEFKETAIFSNVHFIKISKNTKKQDPFQ